MTTSTDPKMTAALAQLNQATTELKAQLVAREGLATAALTATLMTVVTAATRLSDSVSGMNQPVPPLPGLYVTWSELVLALVALEGRDIGAAVQPLLKEAIAAVRILRRRFNLAPGGA